MDPQLIPLPDAAKALGIGVSSLRQLIRDGHIAGAHIGRRHLIATASLRDFAARLAAEDHTALTRGRRPGASS